MKKLNCCPICSSRNLYHYITTSAQMHSCKDEFEFDKCKECDYVFLNPKVSPEQLKDYYTNYYLPYRGSEAWGKYKKLVEKSLKKLDLRKLNTVQNVQSLQSSSLILDVGCGQPSFLKICSDKLNCQTLGLDFSNKGWINQPETYNSIELKVGEISDLQEELKPDVITMWHYLEHDYNPLENLKHLKSISKPSTKLIIEVPNFSSSSRKKFGKHWAGWHTPRHTSLFSPHNLELLLNKAGWELEESHNYGTMDPYLIHWMSKMEEKEISWDKNMEEEIIPFVAGMMTYLPKRLLEKKLSLGILTAIASPVEIK